MLSITYWLVELNSPNVCLHMLGASDEPRQDPESTDHNIQWLRLNSSSCAAGFTVELCVHFGGGGSGGVSVKRKLKDQSGLKSSPLWSP